MLDSLAAGCRFEPAVGGTSEALRVAVLPIREGKCLLSCGSRVAMAGLRWRSSPRTFLLVQRRRLSTPESALSKVELVPVANR